MPSRVSRQRKTLGGRHATFIPLFEALNWAVSIEEFMRADGGALLTDEIVLAMRFARNTVHHNWAHALVAVETPTSPTTGVFEGASTTPTGVLVEWYWRPLDQLPAHRSWKEGESAYTGLLADRPTRETLRQLQVSFNDA